MGENQPEYKTLPSFRTEYSTISRWRLSDEERRHLVNGGDLFLCQLNGKGRLQPIMPLAVPEDQVLVIVFQREEDIGLKA